MEPAHLVPFNLKQSLHYLAARDGTVEVQLFDPAHQHEIGDAARAQAVPTVDLKTLHAKIGELTRKNGFLSGVLGSAGLLASAKR